jgi:branched-chain amino acid transport system substrate-binding protein
MTSTFGKQFGAFLTDQMFMPAMSYFAGPSGVDPKTRAAIAQITAVYKSVNLVPDQIALSAWDPASLLVETLRRAGADAPPAKLRDTLASIRDYGGVNGLFDFTKYPQRGLGAPAVLVIRYDPGKDAYIPVSRLGGVPLGR